MKTRFLIIVALAIPQFLMSQVMITDRPGFSESASIVPLLHPQVEAGIQKTNMDKLRDQNIISTLIRLGLSNNFEIRVGFDHSAKDMITLNEPVISNNIYPAFKYRIINGTGLIPDIAVLGKFTLPVSNDYKEDDFWSPEVRLAAQNTLFNIIDLGANFALFWNNENYDTQKTYSVSLGLNLIPRIGLYGEFYGESIKNLGNTGYMDTGITLSLLENLQLDSYVGFGLNGNSDDMFFGAGIAIRLPN